MRKEFYVTYESPLEANPSRKYMQHRRKMFSKLEMGAFAQLFNRRGYVLDFSTADFNAFTMSSIGMPLCGHYGLSKGQSMLAYLGEADSIDATRLLLDLFEYYEFHFRSEFDSAAEGEFNSYKHEKGKRGLYIKCKEIADRERVGASYLQPSLRYLQKEFSSEFMNDRISLLMEMRESARRKPLASQRSLSRAAVKRYLERCRYPRIRIGT